MTSLQLPSHARQAAGAPLQIVRDTADRGRGYSVDIGGAVVVGPWEAGVGVTGVTNHITWTGVDRITYTLDDLFAGDNDFIESDAVALGDVRATLPADVRGHVGYTAGSWTAVGEVGRGLQGRTLQAGVEQRWAVVAVRGGASYSREIWNPAAGVGVNLSRGFGVDVALYGHSANVQRKRHAAVAHLVAPGPLTSHHAMGRRRRASVCA